MNELKPFDRILHWALGLFVVGCIALLALNGITNRRREVEIHKLGLHRTQQMLQVRMDAMFAEWSEDLLEEAAFVSAADSVDPKFLALRWQPLLASHWTVLAIRLGDDHGNESALCRNEKGSALVRTSMGSKQAAPAASQLTGQGVPDTVSFTWPGAAGYDPRKNIWFSKALENEREQPIWSMNSADTTSQTLQLSYAMENRDAAPLRVLMFDVDLKRSARLEHGSEPLNEAGHVLFTNDGGVLYSAHWQDSLALADVVQAIDTLWGYDRTKKYFDVKANGKSYAVLVEPYLLNGLTLHSAVILDVAPLKAWTATDRLLQWILMALVSILTALLLLLWIRGRRRLSLARRQVRQNQHQAMKLNKLKGEHEVLNREVHHRVKNNLQVVSSLLNLQASSLDDGQVREEFLRGKRRIDTIALVHHKLYGLADLRQVDLKVLFTELVDALAAMNMPQSRTISVGIETENIKCDQDTAIELGMILCELLTNAYQHAFPYATGGHVDVSVGNVEGDLHRLLVHNNGVALPPGGLDGPGKLGLEIVDALSSQLDGSFLVSDKGGPQFEVLFRMRRSAPLDPFNDEEH